MAVDKPQRIVMHWTAGTYDVSEKDKNSYHEIVSGDGERVLGNYRPEANNDVSDGHYAAHVKKFNTGSIGLSMACMKDAEESPFKKGRSPMKEEQLSVFIDMVAEYAFIYDIPIDREHVLSHEEVDITHGIPQDKWDIMWLPDMSKPKDAVFVGDRLRDRIKRAKDKKYGGDSSRRNRRSEADGFEEILAKLIAKIRETVRDD